MPTIRRTLSPLALTAAVLFTTLLGGAAFAHGFKVGELSIVHPSATPTRAGLNTGAVYLHALRNAGEQPDRLVAARTPRAGTVEIHRMQMDGDVMRMRAVPSLELPAKGEVVMRPGSHDGHHLMLLDLKQPLREGDRFPLTLVFERAGEREVEVWVEAPKSGQAEAPHKH